MVDRWRVGAVGDVEDPASGGPKGDSPPPVEISYPPVRGARRGEFETGGARREDVGGADAFVTSAGANAAGSKTDPVGSHSGRCR